MNTIFTGSLMMVKVIFILFILVLSSCKNKNDPNYLIILIENLNSKAIYCDTEENQKKRSGFQVVCDEFHKFTHVYTTSTQGLPALTSLLTGLYPYDHKVRSNTENYLTPEFQTFIEDAKENENYKTRFISGGQPFFRKSGIHQGFDLFDDHISSEKDMRSLNENLEIYFSQLQNEKKKKHISLIHVSDLKYTFKETQNELAETRNLTFDSQIEEVDEKLFFLFSKLKSEKSWDNLKVFIIGLNGLPNVDINAEFSQLNLKSDSTQVAFYFKDVKKNAINAKPQVVSTVLSLKDIGEMFKNSFQKTKTESESYESSESSESREKINEQAANFKDFDIEKVKEINQERSDYIVIESAWAKSNQLGDIRAAIIDENYLFIFDKQFQLFNRLSDSNEQYPQPLNGFLVERIKRYEKYLFEKNYQLFEKSKNLKSVLNDFNLLIKENYSQNYRSEFYEYFKLLSLIEKKDLAQIELMINKNPDLKKDECLNGYPKLFISIGKKRNCHHLASRLFLDYIDPELSNNKDLKVFVQSELSSLQVVRNLYRKNLKLNLDYFPIATFKVENIRPYIILTLGHFPTN